MPILDEIKSESRLGGACSIFCIVKRVMGYRIGVRLGGAFEKIFMVHYALALTSHGTLKVTLEIDVALPCRAFENPKYPRPRATLPLVACPGLAWRGPLGLNSFERDVTSVCRQVVASERRLRPFAGFCSIFLSRSA